MHGLGLGYVTDKVGLGWVGCGKLPAARFLIVFREIVVAIAHAAGRQEQLRLAGVGEGAVVIVEEQVEGDEQRPRCVQEILHQRGTERAHDWDRTAKTSIKIRPSPAEYCTDSYTTAVLIF